jgi:hypothetical protein
MGSATAPMFGDWFLSEKIDFIPEDIVYSASMAPFTGSLMSYSHRSELFLVLISPYPD